MCLSRRYATGRSDSVKIPTMTRLTAVRVSTAGSFLTNKRRASHRTSGASTWQRRGYSLTASATTSCRTSTMSQLGCVGEHWKAHSETGWETEDTFGLYLMHISEWFGGQHVDLVCDLHTSHHTEFIKKLAMDLNISLHFIPAGCTDDMQPLDRKVFGAVKGTAKLLFRQSHRHDPDRKIAKPDAVQSMIRAWDSLDEATIQEAWSCYF